MNKNIEFYNKNADSYFKTTINLDMSEWIDRFISYIPEGGRILDAGCGSGRDSKTFISKGFSVVAFDGSKALCSLASEYIGQTVLNMCFDEISYENEFDGIWACASLLHVSYDELIIVIDRLKRSLKQSGVFYASFKYGNNISEVEDRSFANFTEETLIEMFLKAGFVVKDCGFSMQIRDDNTKQKWVNIIAEKD